MRFGSFNGATKHTLYAMLSHYFLGSHERPVPSTLEVSLIQKCELEESDTNMLVPTGAVGPEERAVITNDASAWEDAVLGVEFFDDFGMDAYYASKKNKTQIAVGPLSESWDALPMWGLWAVYGENDKELLLVGETGLEGPVDAGSTVVFAPGDLVVKFVGLTPQVLESKILDFFFGGSPHTPSDLFVGLSTSDPGEDGSQFTEPSDGMYERVQLSTFGVSNYAANGVFAFADSMFSFPESNSDYTATHYGYFTDAQGGELVKFAPFAEPLVVRSGDVVESELLDPDGVYAAIAIFVHNEGVKFNTLARFHNEMAAAGTFGLGTASVE